MQSSLALPDLASTSAGPARRPKVEPLLTLAERAGLDAAPWFSELAPPLRQEILRHCEVRSLRHEAAVYDDDAPGLCGVASGAVAVALAGAQSRVLYYVPAGTWVLDSAALFGGPPLLRLQAHRRATVARLPAEALRELLRRQPAAAAAMQALGHAAVCHLTPILQELAALPLRPRLARCLGRLCEGFGVAQPDGTRIRIALHQDEIAHMLYACRQRVNIELKLLEAAGVLRIGKELVVLDRAALQAAAG